MSVMLIEQSVYVKVYNTLFINRDERIKRLAVMGEVKLYKELNKLYLANQQSYINRYKEDMELEQLFVDPQDFTRFNNFELLKAMESIHYQIEIDNFDYSFIKRVIERIKDVIIQDLEEYQKADYC